jgi:hypothetical protein
MKFLLNMTTPWSTSACFYKIQPKDDEISKLEWAHIGLGVESTCDYMIMYLIQIHHFYHWS